MKSLASFITKNFSGGKRPAIRLTPRTRVRVHRHGSEVTLRFDVPEHPTREPHIPGIVAGNEYLIDAPDLWIRRSTIDKEHFHVTNDEDGVRVVFDHDVALNNGTGEIVFGGYRYTRELSLFPYERNSWYSPSGHTEWVFADQTSRDT